MAKVMFTISYGIKPERREEYLSLIRKIRDHLTGVEKKNYLVFEAKGKKNHFTEVFVTNSVEEFDALDDNQDERVEDMLSELEGMMDDGGKKYATMIEPI